MIHPKLRALLNRARGLRGAVEGFRDGALIGWVMARGARRLRVGVFARGALLAEGWANILRGDLVAAGFGRGDGGFHIPLDRALLRVIAARSGGVVEVRLLNQDISIGHCRIGAEHLAFDAPPPAVGKGRLAEALAGRIVRLQELAGEESPNGVAPTLSAARGLFSARDPRTGAVLPPPLFAYADYVRWRFRLETEFPDDDAPGFLIRYLTFYGPHRRGLRVPLSRAAIAFLNAPAAASGRSRAALACLGAPQAGPEQAAYDWAIHEAGALHAEDCLVPQADIDLLAAPHPDWAGHSWAPSRFMVRLRAETRGLSALDLARAEDRRRLALCVLLMAGERPDFLRYLPPEAREALLAPGAGGRSAFDDFLAAMGVAMPPVDREIYVRLMRRRGFDLDRLTFTSMTETGDRLHAAMLPAPQGAPVDVQMIGPFEKASGLGQATRLSARIMEQTGYTVSSVDFGLDNPAPVGFSRVGPLSEFRPARVNLLQLNAESVPLAFAYAPDVFSGAYNIGYFYWELDSPAACHALALDLLDEVWVATDYGVSIYRPHTPKPVVNVGMCAEEVPRIDRVAARRELDARFGFGGAFVFLVAFDSFSYIQRKNPLGTLRAFLAAFPQEHDVRLVIKTQNRRRVTDPVQVRIWAELDALVGDDPRIVILDETLAYDALLRLKAGCDCYVSLHRSEGWGFGMIEAMNLRVPVVCTAYSGNLDFCSEETAWLVGAREVEVSPEDYIFVLPGQKWAEPDVAQAAQQLRAVYADPQARARKAEAAFANVRANFSTEAIARRYRTRLDDIFRAIG